MDQREDLLDDLKAAAEPLASSCTPEVSQKIEAAVEEAVTAWNDTCQSLLDLCNRYQDAVKLWKQYREASEAVKAWADQQLESVVNLKPEDTLKQVKVSALSYSTIIFLIIGGFEISSVLISSNHFYVFDKILLRYKRG